MSWSYTLLFIFLFIQKVFKDKLSSLIMWFNSLRIWTIVILVLAWVVWHFYTKIVRNEEDDLKIIKHNF